MFELAFMQRALAAAVLIGLVGGALGFFVVLRRLAFVGVGISHAALGGVAIGVLAGVSPLLCGGAVGLAVALLVARSSRSGLVSEDTAIGVFFSGALALGIALASASHGAQQDLFAYLFGNVLAIAPAELGWLALLSAGVLGALARFLEPLLFASFDAEIADAYGLPVAALHALLLALIAATVVIGMRVVGVLLVEAMLVIPAATAALWTLDYRRQLALAASLGVASTAGGLALGYALDLAPGATAVLLASAAFAFSYLARRGTGGAAGVARP
jgi:ABC-type Mn2+/Zn2+ transport system permease subunit